MATSVGNRPPAKAPVSAVFALLATAILLYLSTLRELVAFWADDLATSHGYFIAAVVPAMIWLRRGELTVAPDRAWQPIGAMALATALWVLAKAATLSVVCWALWPVLAWLAVRIAFGAATGRALAVPLGYAVFATPALKHLAPPLQSVSVAASAFCVRLAGLRAEVLGNVIAIPEGGFEVTEACAGVQFLTVALATATLYAFVERLPRRQTLLLLAASAVVSQVANWARIVAIIGIGHATNMQSPLVAHHDPLSWLIFAIAMAIFIATARSVLPAGPPDHHRARAATLSATPAPRLLGAVVPLVAALAIGPAIAAVLDARARAQPTPLLNLPALRGWEGPLPADSDWRPQFPGAAATRLATYRRGAAHVELFIVAYTTQDHERKLLGGQSSLAAPERWGAKSESRLTEPGPLVETLLDDRAHNRRVVWFWYEADGRRLTTAAELKRQMMLQVVGAPARYGIVAFSARCSGDCSTATAALAEAYRAGISLVTAGTALP